MEAVAASPGAQALFVWTGALALLTHFVAFVILQNRYLDAVTWGLTALGLIACAVVVLRTPDDEWDLPPRPRVPAHPILVG